MSAYHGCIQNELLALHNRHLVRKAEPDEQTVRAVARHWLGMLPKWLGVAPLSEEEVIELTTPSKRERVRRAFEEYRRDGYLPKDRVIRMFVKHEKAEDGLVERPEDKDPRAIQYRSFKHTALFKKHLMPIEHRLWKLGQNLEERAPNEERIFSKNLNPRSIAANLRHGWEGFSDPVADLWDVSRMDAHMGKFVREFIEFPTYRSNCPSIEPFLEVMRHNRGYTKSGVKYSMEYTMCSGEACTSSGDSIVMAAVLKYIYRDTPCHILVCGDDSVVIRDRHFQPDIDIFAGCGLPVKFEQAGLFEHVEFCQTRPVLVDGVWTMVRNPDRVLSRSGDCIHNFQGDQAYADWIASVGVGELASAPGVPIIQALADKYRSLGHARKEFVNRYLEGKRTLNNTIVVPVSDQTRLSFWLAWGWSPDAQRRIESLAREGTELDLVRSVH